MFEKTIYSLLNQTVKPKQIFVCLNRDSEPIRFNQVTYFWLNRPLNTSFTRVPYLINMALPSDSHVLISGDDSEYDSNYVETLLKEIELDPKVGLISGCIIEKGVRHIPQNPEGSGRLINSAFFKGKKFPESLIWESWLILEAQRLGFTNKVNQRVSFIHLRPLGNRTVRTFGHVSYMLGYPLFYMLLRVATYLVSKQSVSKKDTFYMLLGQIEATLLRFPKSSLYSWNYRKQTLAMVNGKWRNRILRR